MHKRILHLIHTPRFSGAEILVRDLCLTHKEKGIQSAIASFIPTEDNFKTAQDQLVQSGVQLFIPDKQLKGFARAVFYAKAIRMFRPDVVYAHSALPATYGRLALLLCFYNTTVIPVLHASGINFSGSLFLSELILSCMTKHVISVSESAALAYRKCFPCGPAIQIVPNGINSNPISLASNNRLALRKSYDLIPEDRLIVQVGRLTTLKQQAKTLKAALPLIKNNKNIKLWFAGLIESTEIENDLNLIINNAGVRDQIKILGGRNDIPDLLAAADLFTMPSIIESQGIALLEALASGIAVVASNIPPFQFATQYEGVSLINPDDQGSFTAAIEKHLLEDKRATRDLSSFSIERTAATYGGYEEP